MKNKVADDSHTHTHCLVLFYGRIQIPNRIIQNWSFTIYKLKSINITRRKKALKTNELKMTVNKQFSA